MLQESLLKVEKSSNQLIINNLEKLIKLLKSFHSGEIIYPGVLKRNLNISIENSYEVLKVLEEIGLIKKNYFIQCCSCNHRHPKIFNELHKAISYYENCEACDKDFEDILDSIMVIYRVNNNA